MDVFAVLALSGLGLMALMAVGHRYFAIADEFRAFATIAFGVGLAWLADLNMWRMWGIHVREPWIGVTLTGLVLAGIAYFWHELLGFFDGLMRKYHDEAEVLEKTQELRRIA